MYRINGARIATGTSPVRRYERGDTALCSDTTVKLQEFHAKTLLSRAGLPVPAYSVASTPAEAREQAASYLDTGCS